MDKVLAVLGIILYAVTLWTGYHKGKLSSFPATVLFIAELVLSALTVIGLGWSMGLLIVGITNLLALLLWSVRLAMEHDDILTYAATQTGATREQIKALAKRLGHSGKVFRVMGWIRTAQMIAYLSQRGRDVEEIEQMAPAIATLWVVHRPELETFVSDYDRLMRLWRKPASEAMAVADTLSIAGQKSRATFPEMVAAMIAFADPFQKNPGDPSTP